MARTPGIWWYQGLDQAKRAAKMNTVAHRDRSLWASNAGFLLSASLAVIASQVHGGMAWAFAAVAGVAAVLILTSVTFGRPFARLGPEVALEDRALAVANRVRSCDRKAFRSPPFEFSSAYGLSQTALKHLDRAEQHRPPRRARRYTKQLHRQVQETIESLAIAGYRDDHLRPYLTGEVPDASGLDSLAMSLFWLADKLYQTRRGLAPPKLGT